MFVINEENLRNIIKVWLNSKDDIEDSCLEQAYNLANLPFIHKWVCLMPDTHTGKGMPIGGVIATNNVVIPHAVGSDIGCGMVFIATNIKYADVKDIQTGNGTMIQAIVGNIMRSIPTGTDRYKTKMECETMDKAFNEIEKYKADIDLLPLLTDAYHQIGTLGGGNHFIELQVDEEGYLCIMIHSGSRHFGKEIGDYFNAKAAELNKLWYSDVPEKAGLAFLPVDSEYGQRYITWMNLALEYAFENREKMLNKVCEIVKEQIEKHTEMTVEFSDKINCHHNYAALENHYDKNVWVHRKGATRVREGEMAVIPGAMGSYSYVVRGKGNPESFHTSSHGAGRLYSRTGAKAEFSVEKVMVDLKEQGVILGKKNKLDVAEECRFAYKDIDKVMAQQTDIVDVVRKLKTVGVVKG
ncbi:MAG: RtcB family protein [Lachnospiraceae bacterium]|nr:RtcB family protein [Lachnospiraceae bacterium]